MKENLRRPLLFLITVGTGTLIIAVDAPAEVAIAGTVLAGFLALVVTGALDLEDLKPSKIRSAFRELREEKVKPPVATGGPEKSDAPGAPKSDPGVSTDPSPPASKRPFAGLNLSNISGMLGTFVTSIRETIAHARVPEFERKDRIEKIDAMLNQAVEGTTPDPPSPITPVPPKAGGHSVDPLASLADLELGALDDLDLNGEGSGPGMMFESDGSSLLSAEDTDAISDILKAHQDDLDDFELASGIDIPTGADESAAPLPPMAVDAPDLSGGDVMLDMSSLDEELSTLDDLDLDEIEIEGENEGEEVDAEEPALVEEVLEELEEEPEEEFDMVSFAAGGTVDDDLITSLKSDTKKKKFVEDVSLIRELKGEKYEARELASELEDILTVMKSQ